MKENEEEQYKQGIPWKKEAMVLRELGDLRGISYWTEDNVIQYRTGVGEPWGIIFHSSVFNTYIGNLEKLKQ